MTIPSSNLDSPSSQYPLRYAVLWHSAIDKPHYDLMFETSPGSALATWRSPVWPISESTSVIKLRDHRPAFLDFQGQLTGDRGSVTQITTGTCQVEADSNSRLIIILCDGSSTQKLVLQQEAEERWSASTMGFSD